MDSYYYSRKLKMPFEEVADKITRTLQQHGFYVVTIIDLKKILKQKQGIDFRNYRILGACDPELAFKTIALESHSGLMLPYHLVLQEHENGEVEVSAVNMEEKIDVIPQFNEMNLKSNTKLRNALDDLREEVREPNRMEHAHTET